MFTATGKNYSMLKHKNVLESDVFVKYCVLVEESKEIQEALDLLIG